MKFDLISDMHTTHNPAWEDQPAYDGISREYPWHLQKQSDVLVIAGDCSNDPWDTLRVVDEASQFYPYVLFTDGNHEHYNRHKQYKELNVRTNTEVFEKFARNSHNVHYLNGTSVTIMDTLFIGANGWYDWTANSFYGRESQHEFWKGESNDSKCIRFSPGGYPDKMARMQAETLRELVVAAQDDESIRNIVAITHTIPTRQGCYPDTHQWGHLNGSYVNMFMQQVWMADRAKKIKAWCFGHTHTSYDFDLDGIRFLNNSRDYAQKHRKPEFEGVKMIDLDNPPPRSAFEL